MLQNETQVILQKHFILKQHSKFQNFKLTSDQQKFPTIFNFQHSKIKQQEFEQLAELLLKYPIVYATSKFDD